MSTRADEIYNKNRTEQDKTRDKNLCKYLLLLLAGLTGGRINFVSCLILAVAVAGVDTPVIPKQ